MSAGSVFQEALRIVIRQSLPEVARGDVLAALEAGRPGPLEFLYEAGAEAALPPEKIISRSAAIYFNFCAGNLSDDLSDSECSYLDDPYRIGPCTQLILQNLFFHALVHAQLPTQTVLFVVQELIAAVGPQHIELRTTQWSARVYQEVAEGIAGHQWSAYLTILWSETALDTYAATVGMKAGIAAHVAKDIQSRDARYTTLSKGEKVEIVSWAIAAMQMLQAQHLVCVDALVRTIDPVLRQAL